MLSGIDPESACRAVLFCMMNQDFGQRNFNAWGSMTSSNRSSNHAEAEYPVIC